MSLRGFFLFLSLLLPATVLADTIQTQFLQRTWPGERVDELEVGRTPVRWRQRASRTEGLLGGVRFTVPLERQLALPEDIGSAARHERHR